MATQDGFCAGGSRGTAALGLQKLCSDWEEGASTQAVPLVFLEEDAGSREMHLVLRSVCSKQLLEQSGAVFLLSGGVFL